MMICSDRYGSRPLPRSMTHASQDFDLDLDLEPFSSTVMARIMGPLTQCLVAVIVGMSLTLVSAAPLSTTGPNRNDDPTTVTLSDSKLSATIGVVSNAGEFGVITELKTIGGANMIKGGVPGGSIWSATFVGASGGRSTLASLTASCHDYQYATANSTSASLGWDKCNVSFASDASSSTSSSNDNVTWVEHNASSCSGVCLAKNSNGPQGGHCDRMPGCGHDAHLPYCDVEAMKARCLNATGCTAFNTNGYLYSGAGVAPFSAYPLQCYTDGPPPPPPPPPATVSITLNFELVDGLLEMNIIFDSLDCTGQVSLWDYTVSLSPVVTTSQTQTVATTAARQLTGQYEADGTGAAVYFAAHDPAHIMKTCGTSDGTLHCTMLALNATLPLVKYVAAFPMVTTVLDGDWWDIASVYRAWVLPNALWTALGPLDTRTDMPDWLENITLWMNNNWGGDPLGPNYGGDPEYVKNEMLKVNGVLDLPAHGGHLALHWYEWDTLGYALGSNHTKCDRVGAPCGFDTHYPNYFPARQGCKESIAAMQSAGMRVIPYINGQLFDTLIPRYAADNALAAVQKFVVTEMMRQDPAHPVPIAPHLEHFDHITSAVMCPVTKYWHDVMRDTVLEIVNDLGFDGAYIDQVGNGEVRNCADPTHNHTINGGSFWAEAFYSIMTEVRAGVPPKRGMYMTEGTVEQVSGPGFDILLGLAWTELPYWHAIYGGYGYATGRAGSISSALADGLCTELTKQFMVGGTMGWFTYQNYKDQFFDPANAPEIKYIQALSQARIAAKKWMVHGRATRSLALADTTGLLLGACFLREKSTETNSVVCAVALPQTSPKGPPTYSLAIDPKKYGLDVPANSHVVLTDLQTGAAHGTFAGNITYTATVPDFGVQLLLLTIA